MTIDLGVHTRDAIFEPQSQSDQPTPANKSFSTVHMCYMCYCVYYNVMSTLTVLKLTALSIWSDHESLSSQRNPKPRN